MRAQSHTPSLDGLRGVAVLLVVTMHMRLLTGDRITGIARLDSFFRGGGLGVDIFFVLSGYLITSILLNYDRLALSRRLRTFYGRRFMRLLPALVLLLTVFALVTVLDGATLASRVATVVSTLFYIQNLNLHIFATEFDGRLGHLWSLAIEEQFYLVWPLILYAIRRVSRSMWSHVAFVSVLIVVVALYRLERFNHGGNWVVLYSRTDTRADGLLVGCLFAFLFQLKIIPRLALQVLATLGALTIAVAMSSTKFVFTYIYQGGFTLVAFCAGCMVLALAENAWFMSRLLCVRPLRNLGKVSYGLYLWHLPVIFLVAEHSRTWSRVSRVGVATALSLLCTVISWFFVEKAALRVKEKWFPNPDRLAEVTGRIGAGEQKGQAKAQLGAEAD